MIKSLENILENIVKKNETVLKALELLDKSVVKVLFVTEEDKLIGTVTDGDIRRAFLSNISVESTIEKIASYNPKIITSGKENLLNNLFTEYGISAIPEVDEKGQVVKIYYEDNKKNKKRLSKLKIPTVIMAGGLGTRLYPYTKILPKPLIPIADTPICERIINSLYDEGCDEFHMVVNYKKNMIKSYFGELNYNYSLTFWDEEKPLGTGGGLRLLKDVMTGTFILTNCDILIMEEVYKMVDHHIGNKNDATIVCSLKSFEIPYGIVNMTEKGEVASFKEKPSMSFFTNTGYYILNTSVFEYIEEDEVIGMPDILSRMKEDGRKVGVYPISDSIWFDMGQFDSMEGMERKLREMDMT